MTALAVNTPRTPKGPQVRIEVPMADNIILYAGSVTMVASTGYATNAVAAASNKGCPGIATGFGSLSAAGSLGTVVVSDNTTSGPLGASHTAGGIIAVLEEGLFILPATGSLTQAAALSVGYAADDGTNPVHTSQAANEPVSCIIEEFISATSCWARVNTMIAVGR